MAPRSKTIVKQEEIRVSYVQVLVDFLARLDTLHDFCGARNTVVAKSTIIEHADISNVLIQSVKAIFQNQPNAQDTFALIDALAEYGTYKYKSFEYAVLEFVKRARDLLKMPINEMDVSAAGGYNVGMFKSVLMNNLKIPDTEVPKYIVDTSDISQDNVLCHTGKVAITNATYFDKKSEVGISQACQDHIPITEDVGVGLTKAKKECMYFDTINIFDEGNSHYMELMYPNNIASRVEYKDIDKVGVEVYSHMIHEVLTNGRLINLEAKYNKIFNPTNNGFLAQLNWMSKVKSLFDFKRSGDWLQIETYKVVKGDENNPTIFFTIDRPAVARALLKKVDDNLDIPIVCTGEENNVAKITTYGDIPMTMEAYNKMIAKISETMGSALNAGNYDGRVLRNASLEVLNVVHQLTDGITELHKHKKLNSQQRFTLGNNTLPAPYVLQAWVDICQAIGLQLMRYSVFLGRLADDSYRSAFIGQMRVLAQGIPSTVDNEMPTLEQSSQLISLYNSIHDTLANFGVNDDSMLWMFHASSLEALRNDLSVMQDYANYIVTQGYIDLINHSATFIARVHASRNYAGAKMLFSHTIAQVLKHTHDLMPFFTPVSGPDSRREPEFNWNARAASVTEQNANYSFYEAKMKELFIASKTNIAYCIGNASVLQEAKPVLQRFEREVQTLENRLEPKEAKTARKLKPVVTINAIDIDANGELTVKISSLSKCIDSYFVIKKRVANALKKVKTATASRFAASTVSKVQQQLRLLSKIKSLSPSLVKNKQNPTLINLLKGIDEMEADLQTVVATAIKPGTITKARRTVSRTIKTVNTKRTTRTTRRGGNPSDVYSVAEDAFQRLYPASTYHVYPYLLKYVLAVNEIIPMEEAFDDIEYVPRWSEYLPKLRYGDTPMGPKYVRVPIHHIDRYDYPLMHSIEGMDDQSVYINKVSLVMGKTLFGIHNERHYATRQPTYQRAMRMMGTRSAERPSVSSLSSISSVDSPSIQSSRSAPTARIGSIRSIRSIRSKRSERRRLIVPEDQPQGLGLGLGE